MNSATSAKRVVQITNRLGLHARPAAMFAEIAGGYQSAIRVTKDGFEADAKSVLSVMMLAAERGSTLEITAEGEDAEKAVESLASLIHSRFGEE